MSKVAAIVENYLARGYSIRKSGDVIDTHGKWVDRVSPAAANAIRPGSNLAAAVSRQQKKAPPVEERYYWKEKD